MSFDHRRHARARAAECRAELQQARGRTPVQGTTATRRRSEDGGTRSTGRTDGAAPERTRRTVAGRTYLRRAGRRTAQEPGRRTLSHQADAHTTPMSSTSSGTTDLTDYNDPDEQVPRGRSRHAPAARRRRRLATGATAGGGLLLGVAVRTRSGLRRRLAAIAGVALLALGLRERLGGTGGLPAPERTHGESPIRSEHNPRGTGDEPDVPARTPPDEGSIQFTEHQNEEPRPKPDLDHGPHDPRVERGDAETVDLSTASLADEESEAAGPKPEQAYPAQVEDTEPDGSPPEDVSHVVADQPGPGDWRGNALDVGDPELESRVENLDRSAGPTDEADEGE